MSGKRPGPPLTVTDEYLAAILAELRDINARIGQRADPPAPTGRRIRVQEPAPAEAEE